MSDEDRNRYAGKGALHQGSDSSSPYPVSRLAPAIDLVDLARQIERSDQMISSRVSGQLKVIADQVKALQDQARELLQKAQQDQELNHAKCRFQRIPGKIYHLYRSARGQLEFSMLSPDDWGPHRNRTFIGSYRLESDMSWTPADEIAAHDSDESRQTVALLLGSSPHKG